MRNYYLAVLALVLGLCITWPVGTKAESIINSNGIIISEEDYNNFIRIHSEGYIMTMDEDAYEKLLSLDYDTVVSEKKYIATTYNPNLMLTTEVELTEYEYEHFTIPEVVGLENMYVTNTYTTGVSLETTAKILTLSYIEGAGNYDYAVVGATWKYAPTTRVFDVIGFLGYGFTFRNGSQTGTQMYKDASGNWQSIYYSWNGTNIKKFNDGFGISMNLVNQTVQALSLDASCDVQATIDHPNINAAYEHAVNSSVTLAQSQNYTLSFAGLGSVFAFPYNISSKYDGMSGLQINF